MKQNELVCGLFATVPIIEVINPLWAIIAACDRCKHQQVEYDEDQKDYEHRDANYECKHVVNSKTENTERLSEEIFHRTKVFEVNIKN